MLGEQADLLKAFGVDQLLHALTRGEFAARMLLCDFFFPAARLDLCSPGTKIGYLLFHRGVNLIA
jgi:hypothetical protein